MDVVLVRWPVETDRRATLAVLGAPRLLLVEHGTALPTVVDSLEDWIWVPADEAEVQARLATLSARANNASARLPTLDEAGVLRHGGSWTSLPPVESRLAAALLNRYDAVVSRQTLAIAAWPHGQPGRNALDVHMLRLRRRVEPIGLAIKTVRSRGYLLESGLERKTA